MPRRDFLSETSSHREVLSPEGDLGLAPQWLPEKGFLNAREAALRGGGGAVPGAK